MQIIFRVDGSSKIGGGHIMRCAALAKELINRGANVCFLTKTQPGDYSVWLEQNGISVIRLSGGEFNQDADIFEVKNVIKKVKHDVDWLIVDHYQIDELWESQLRPSVKAIMVIDDLADRFHDCDLLLNHNYIHGIENAYERLIPAAAISLLGPKYALLAEGYSAVRKNNLRQRDGKVRRLLICFGATDPHNHTGATLEALAELGNSIDFIDVVTTPQNLNFHKLHEQYRGVGNIRFHCPAVDLPRLLNKADLAIGAGGVMSLERAVLGVPSLCFGIALNQTEVLKTLIVEGMVCGCSFMEFPDISKIRAWLSVVLFNSDLLIGLSHRSLNLLDGYGVSRVADVVLRKNYSFRSAGLSDMDSIYAWRNQNSIRNISINGAPLDYSEHVKWFKDVINDTKKILLVISLEGVDVGVVRFDCDGDQATISIYKTPNSFGAKGLIKQSTNWLKNNRPNIKEINAKVLPGNTISAEAFRNAGYEDGECSFTIRL